MLLVGAMFGVLALAVGAGISLSIASSNSPDPEELISSVAQPKEGNQEVPIAPFEIADFEAIEFHSEAQYLSNVEVYREAILSLPISDAAARERQTAILSSLETRTWVSVGGLGEETCYRNESLVNCVQESQLSAATEAMKDFEDASAEGIGLCYDWFENVCLAGEWFPSVSEFSTAVNQTRVFVVTGQWDTPSDVNQFELATDYEPTASASVEAGELGSDEWWKELAASLWPDRDLDTLFIMRSPSANDPGGKQFFDENPEGFCIGTEFDGDCFKSQQDYESAMSLLLEAYKEGTCSSKTIYESGEVECTAIWVGVYPNHSRMDIQGRPELCRYSCDTP